MQGRGVPFRKKSSSLRERIFPENLAFYPHKFSLGIELKLPMLAQIKFMIMKKGFTLSYDKLGKDQGKANYANAFIGFGVSNRLSSTERYLNDAKRAGVPVNYEISPDRDIVAFVSVASEGIHNVRTIDLAKKVIECNGTVIMDASGTGFGQANSRYNKNGEGKVQEALGKPSGQTKEGYNIWGNIENIIIK